MLGIFNKKKSKLQMFHVSFMHIVLQMLDP